VNKQLQDIAHEFRRRAGKEPMALATLVRTTGSSYLQPGARMLIASAGETIGLLSGGCVEEDVSLRAKDVMRNEPACLMTFDLRPRFGCSGSIEILVERAGPENSFLNTCGESLKDRTSWIGATVFKSADTKNIPLGSSALFRETDPISELLAADAEDMSSSGTQIVTRETSTGTVTSLVQRVRPPVRLIIIGGGRDSLPFAQFARALGWQVTMVCKSGEACEADQSLCCNAEELPRVLQPDDRTVAVVKTHNYGRDFAFLQTLLPLGLPYIGLVGSRKRKEQLIGALLDLGANLEAVKTIYGPAGMDIGAESPEEIALSVIAEIQAVLSEHACHSLRERKGPIHAAAAVAGVSDPGVFVT
jgi:xanthine dehydrogenase accessory factor